MIRRLVSIAVTSMIAAACAGTASPSTGGPSVSLDPTAFAAEVASIDHYVDAPQRLQIGIYSATDAGGVVLVTFGQVSLSLTGPGGEQTDTTARYVPAPGTPGEGAGPTLSEPGAARGVYQAEDVTFASPGTWQAQVSLTVDGAPLNLTAAFPVAREPKYPAPGQRAPLTQNLTMRSDAPPQAIDSRAQDGAPVPDFQLHRVTIADAIAQGRPVVAVFASPVYCVSQFCGPSTDAVEQLAAQHGDEADFIHVEIWRNFNGSVVNAGAAEWVMRSGAPTDPWLFLIDGRGVIVDRWMPLFDPNEVAGELANLS